MTSTALRFTLIEQCADDPQSNRTWTGLTAAGIRAGWPFFAELFPDDCAGATLTYTIDLKRWHIQTEYDS